MPLIQIDGSKFEGGGQIIRTAMSLSCITGKPFKAQNIRKGRAKPGLKMQHVICGKALQKISSAKTSGLYMESTELEFYPGELRGGVHEIEIGTAGSITLLMQCLAIPCIFANKRSILKVRGGTDVRWSMSSDYYQNIIIPYYKRYAKEAEYTVMKQGYYPRGSGAATLRIVPYVGVSEFMCLLDFRKHLEEKPLNITDIGKLFSIKIKSKASVDMQEAKIAERQAESAKIHLRSYLTKKGISCPVNAEYSYSNTESSGAVLFAEALLSKETSEFEEPIRIGTDIIGDKNTSPEELGQKIAEQLIKELESGCLDQHLSDNLIILLALSGGKILAQKTGHTEANKYVVEKFLGGKFQYSPEKKFLSYSRESESKNSA